MPLLIPESASRYAAQQRASVTDYVESVTGDADKIRPWLVPGSVLDIGCGVGGCSALLGREVYLLDGTGWADRRVGWGDTMEPFNDMSVTEEVMLLNGVQYHIVPFGAEELPEVDNVISLLSWCWHYPSSVYLDAVAKALRKGGSLIVDVRRGMKFKDDRFTQKGVVQSVSSGKGKRVCFQRK